MKANIKRELSDCERVIICPICAQPKGKHCRFLMDGTVTPIPHTLRNEKYKEFRRRQRQ